LAEYISEGTPQESKMETAPHHRHRWWGVFHCVHTLKGKTWYNFWESV